MAETFNIAMKHRILSWTDDDRQKCFEFLEKVTSQTSGKKYTEKQLIGAVERLYKRFVIGKSYNHRFTPRQEERFVKWLNLL